MRSSSIARPTSSRHIASISPVGAFDLALDLVEREGIIGALVPVTLAVDGVKAEAGLLRGQPPVVALGAGDALHGVRLAAAGEMRGEAVREAAEAAARHWPEPESDEVPDDAWFDEESRAEEIAARRRSTRGAMPAAGRRSARPAFAVWSAAPRVRPFPAGSGRSSRCGIIA